MELLIMILVICIVMYIGYKFVLIVVLPFESERRFIKMEIGRACDDKERKQWKKKLRILYLKHIPIINLFIK